MPAVTHMPLLFAVIAACVTSLGLLIVAFNRQFDRSHAQLFGVAAAGLLITFCFLHLLPEAVGQTPTAATWVMVGFLSALGLSHGLRALRGHTSQPDSPDEAYAAVAAIAAHSLVDGLVYTVTFNNSFSSGLFTAIGLITHELPEGIIAFSLLYQTGMRTPRALLIAFAAAGLTTPLGVILSGPAIAVLGEATLTHLFAASVGLLFFVATGPLLAPIRTVAPRSGLGALAIGVIAGLAILASPVGAHDHS
ncbi:MAG: ZIP family metal transporter, partial [Pseudomonadota bacterium]